MHTSANRESRAGPADGRASAADAARTANRLTIQPVSRNLSLAYALSLAVAVFTAGVSVAGLALGPAGLYGPDPRAAAGIVASTAGIVVPGFLAHDAFNLAVGLLIFSLVSFVPLTFFVRGVAQQRPLTAA